MIIDIAKPPPHQGGFASAIEYCRDLAALGIKAVWEQASNLTNPEQPALEMERTASMSPWCQNPILNFVISWQFGERPGKREVLWLVHEKLRRASSHCTFSDGAPVDLTQLQLVLFAHDNTDNFHVHGVLNLVHPVSFAVPNLNRGYYQKLFQHSLRFAERVFDWSLLPNNPCYEARDGKQSVLYRVNKLQARRLSAGQDAFQVYTDSTSPELRLQKLLHGYVPEHIGSAQAVDRFLQSRCIHYQAFGDRCQPLAFFVLDGHRVPASRIRTDMNQSLWTVTSLRSIFPELPKVFSMGYPISKMRRRRKRRPRTEEKEEWQMIANDLARMGRARISSGQNAFVQLGAEHFVVHAELPDPGLRYKPSPAERAKPSGRVERFTISSCSALESVALRLRVAEDRGARIKFIPVRKDTVYVGVLNLTTPQVATLQETFIPALILREAKNNHSVLMAVMALPDHDVCMAAIRLLEADLHRRFHKTGLPPAPFLAVSMPGFRPTLGQRLPSDPPADDVHLVKACNKICSESTRLLAMYARQYREQILPNRGTLYAIAGRRLAALSSDEPCESAMVNLAKAHLCDLHARAIPPISWQEVDQRLSFRLRMIGLDQTSLAELLMRLVPLMRPTPDELPRDFVAHAEAITRWAMQISSDIIPERTVKRWRTLEANALASLVHNAGRAQAHQPLHPENKPCAAHTKPEVIKPAISAPSVEASHLHVASPPSIGIAPANDIEATRQSR